jgi:2-methylisocitrate lyase-like PEP mutase family enzyme
MDKYQLFKSFHASEEILFLGNTHDVLSAMLFEHAGFKALGTTSWGISNTLGFNDGENIDFNDYLFVVKKIIGNVSIPVSVDIEGGYSDCIETISRNVLTLADCGVVGINFEDSSKKICGLRDLKLQSDIISTLRNKLDNNGYKDFFINARTDTYLQKIPNSLQETLIRAKAYAECGANGLFVPGVSTNSDIETIVKNTHLPLNVLSLPQLTSLKHMNKLGVKRLSIGNAFSDLMLINGEKIVTELWLNGDTSLLYNQGSVNLKFKDKIFVTDSQD